jgi:hypothetical protein
VLSGWALPENWRKGMRPQGKNGNGQANGRSQAARSSGGSNGNHRPPSGDGGNGQNQTEKANGSRSVVQGDALDERILRLEKAVGAGLYRNILREYGRVNQPKLIRDVAAKRKVLGMLESVVRGIDRLDAVTKRLDPNTVKALLEKLQAPPLNEIADIKTLQNVVLGLEELAGPKQHDAA